jgi:hypothetical protein
MHRTFIACTCVLLAASATPARAESAKPGAEVPAATISAAERSLEGIWFFDSTRSDDPRKAMESMRGGGGGRRDGARGGGFGGGMGRGMGGFGGGRRHGGGEGGMRGGDGDRGGDDGGAPPAEGEGARTQGPRPFERVMRPAHKVVIEMRADAVNVAEDEHEPRGYALSDSLKAHGHDLVTEGTTARWKSAKLEMTQAMGRRGSLVETYEISKDGKTLTIRAHREGGPEGMPNATITRVYTRYEGD